MSFEAQRHDGTVADAKGRRCRNTIALSYTQQLRYLRLANRIHLGRCNLTSPCIECCGVCGRRRERVE
eukprot:scaffold142013_cov31-Tisochrysis_lutea.AAC.4